MGREKVSIFGKMFWPGNCLFSSKPVHPVSLPETWLLLGTCVCSAPLDSVPTVLLTVFCQLWCWNPAETQMCQKLMAKGHRVPLTETLCQHLSGPPLVRSCQMPVCRSKYGNPHFVESAHSVLLLQWLHFP